MFHGCSSLAANANTVCAISTERSGSGANFSGRNPASIAQSSHAGRYVPQVRDPAKGTLRPCELGDIALLAPVGTELWRFEEALEERGIAVSTQAGKGFFRRQEIQDLIALARALA